jgi:hypothetical protein
MGVLKRVDMCISSAKKREKKTFKKEKSKKTLKNAIPKKVLNNFLFFSLYFFIAFSLNQSCIFLPFFFFFFSLKMYAEVES